jgi:hypothetical protein
LDNFLPNFDEFYDKAVSRDFSGVVNPADGVFYPDISLDMDFSQFDWLEDKSLIFLRRSSKGVFAPHGAHNDVLMGKWTALFYIEGEGGTSFLRHKTHDMEFGVLTEEELGVWERDTNNPDMWDVTNYVDLVKNRLAIFPSNYMHRAEPIGGYGQGKSSRLVMTCFFNGDVCL